MASLEREDTLNTPRFQMLPRRTEHKVEVADLESDRLPPVAVILQETLSLGFGDLANRKVRGKSFQATEAVCC